MTFRLRPHRTLWLALLAACLLASLVIACGGGDEEGGGAAARNPTDPRRVPTATIPATPPSPIAALDGGLASSRPALPETYVVKSGDTLGSIAAELGVATEELVRANPNIDPRGLRIGQELRIPRATPTPNPRATASPGGARSPSPTPAAAASPTPTRAGTTASPTPAASPGAARTPSPAPGGTPTPAGSPSAGASTYTVQSGDTGCAIARRFMVSVQQLAAANGLSVEALASLRIGQTLQIPRSTGADPGC